MRGDPPAAAAAAAAATAATAATTATAAAAPTRPAAAAAAATTACVARAAEALARASQMPHPEGEQLEVEARVCTVAPGGSSGGGGGHLVVGVPCRWSPAGILEYVRATFADAPGASGTRASDGASLLDYTTRAEPGAPGRVTRVTVDRWSHVYCMRKTRVYASSVRAEPSSAAAAGAFGLRFSVATERRLEPPPLLPPRVPAALAVTAAAVAAAEATYYAGGGGSGASAWPPLAVQAWLPPPAPPPGSPWTSVRHKVRISFRTPDGHFRVDITTVSMVDVGAVGPPQRRLELEVELLPTAAPHPDLAPALVRHAMRLVELAQYVAREAPPLRPPPGGGRTALLLPPAAAAAAAAGASPGSRLELRGAPNSPFRALGIRETHVPEAERGARQQELSRCIGRDCKAFPGSMPVNLSHAQLEQIARRDYYVSEKTDGVRAILIIDHRAVTLVDRSFAFWETPFPRKLSAIFGLNGGTILDGELILHEDTRRPYYLAFDCISANGAIVATQNLHQRLLAVGKLIAAYRRSFTLDDIHEHPFMLFGKSVLHKDHYGTVIKRFQSFPAAGYTVYREPRDPGDASATWYRAHRTDGLVFAPNEQSYAFKMSNTILKWKFDTARSLDVLIYTRQLLVHPAVAAGPDADAVPPVEMLLQCTKHQVIAKRTHFTPDDTVALLRDCMRIGWPDTVVGEFLFQHGYWRYQRLRADKARPNHIGVAFDTLESIAEDLRMDDIVAALQGRPPVVGGRPREATPPPSAASSSPPSAPSSSSSSPPPPPKRVRRPASPAIGAPPAAIGAPIAGPPL